MTLREPKPSGLRPPLPISITATKTLAAESDWCVYLNKIIMKESSSYLCQLFGISFQHVPIAQYDLLHVPRLLES